MFKLFLLAEETPADSGCLEMLPSLGIIALMFVLLYFLMIRPQRKQEKEQQQMRDALAVGDEVTTIGGIVGKVVAVHEETVIIETSKDKTHIRFLRRAIGTIDVKAEDNVVPLKEAAPAPAEQKPAAAPKKKKAKTSIEPAQVKEDVAPAPEADAQTPADAEPKND